MTPDVENLLKQWKSVLACLQNGLFLGANASQLLMAQDFLSRLIEQLEVDIAREKWQATLKKEAEGSKDEVADA